MVLGRDKPALPLLVATETNDIEMIECLISSGASLNDQDQERFSALHIATITPDCADALQYLLRQPLLEKDVRLLNGSLPLHSAGSRGTADTVRALLDAGYDIKSTNDSGRTALHWAAVARNWAAIEVVLDRGADVNIRANEGGRTLLWTWHISLAEHRNGNGWGIRKQIESKAD